MNAHKLPSGAWRVQVTIDGKRKSITRPTKKEAELAALEYAIGKKKEAANMTVGMAVDQYIDSKDSVLSPSTIQGYRQVRKHMLPSIMDMPIQDITKPILQRAFNEAAKAEYSRKTLSNTRGLIHSALSFIDVEMPDITLPAKQKPQIELLPLETIIQVVRGTNIEIPVLLACCLSLSVSEIRGLEYSDIHDGYLTVTRTMLRVSGENIERDGTKAYERRRTIRVPEYLLNLIGTGEGKIVDINGSALYCRWSRLLKRNGLPHMRFHDLRHLNASIMLALGIPDKYAMERGGWSTDYVMKNVYQHTMSDEREAVDKRMTEYMQHAIETAHESAHETR